MSSFDTPCLGGRTACPQRTAAGSERRGANGMGVPLDRHRDTPTRRGQYCPARRAQLAGRGYPGPQDNADGILHPSGACCTYVARGALLRVGKRPLTCGYAGGRYWVRTSFHTVSRYCLDLRKQASDLQRHEPVTRNELEPNGTEC